jgi:hypothetical protein
MASTLPSEKTNSKKHVFKSVVAPSSKFLGEFKCKKSLWCRIRYDHEFLNEENTFLDSLGQAIGLSDRLPEAYDLRQAAGF